MQNCPISILNGISLEHLFFITSQPTPAPHLPFSLPSFLYYIYFKILYFLLYFFATLYTHSFPKSRFPHPWTSILKLQNNLKTVGVVVGWCWYVSFFIFSLSNTENEKVFLWLFLSFFLFSHLPYLNFKCFWEFIRDKRLEC